MSTRRARVDHEGARVTPLELFFDLVFVYVINQVTQLMAADPTVRGVVRGMLLLALLWWCWCCYSWLGNRVHARRRRRADRAVRGDGRDAGGVGDPPRGVRRPAGRSARSAGVRGVLPVRAGAAPGVVLALLAR
nr:low temperature requirement protein A [Saccharothrix sp.]